MEIKDKIKELYAHKDYLSDEEKAEVKAMCKAAGIKTSFNKRCPNCYADAVLLLMLHYGVKAEDVDVLTPSGNYVYHNGSKKVVWWYRHSYTELSANTDDATIGKYIAVHPLQKHYSRVEPEPEPEQTETAETAETVSEGENGVQNNEQTEGGAAEQTETENGSEGQNIASNEGENGEGDKVTEGDNNETNE